MIGGIYVVITVLLILISCFIYSEEIVKPYTETRLKIVILSFAWPLVIVLLVCAVILKLFSYFGLFIAHFFNDVVMLMVYFVSLSSGMTQKLTILILMPML